MLPVLRGPSFVLASDDKWRESGVGGHKFGAPGDSLRPLVREIGSKAATPLCSRLHKPPKTSTTSQ